MLPPFRVRGMCPPRRLGPDSGPMQPEVASNVYTSSHVRRDWRTKVPEKVMRFQGKNKDLNQLGQQIAQQLQSEGYKVQTANPPLGIVVQAQKAGILRDIIAADRAFTILLTGQPDDFTIHIGVGKWVQNIAVAAAEALFLSVLFIAVDVPEMLWTQIVEKGLAKEITQIVG